MQTPEDAPDAMIDALQQRVMQLEADVILLKTMVANLTAFAQPQARLGIVSKLNGPVEDIGPRLPRGMRHEAHMREQGRLMLTMIASDAG